jgi:hypothetical protein
MQTQHDHFDPAQWLARWSAAGGAWAGRRLLIPQPDANLRRMIRDLAFDEAIALAEHMDPHAEAVE